MIVSCTLLPIQTHIDMAAALGNPICPRGTMAAPAPPWMKQAVENTATKQTLVAFAIILVMYMVLAMLYTCVLFPNFGM